VCTKKHWVIPPGMRYSAPGIPRPKQVPLAEAFGPASLSLFLSQLAALQIGEAAACPTPGPTPLPSPAQQRLMLFLPRPSRRSLCRAFRRVQAPALRPRVHHQPKDFYTRFLLDRSYRIGKPNR
jgi:hypothetical protein